MDLRPAHSNVFSNRNEQKQKQKQEQMNSLQLDCVIGNRPVYCFRLFSFHIYKMNSLLIKAKHKGI